MTSIEHLLSIAMDQKLYSCVYSSGKAWRERCADMYVFQMIPRAVPDMYMRAYPRLCRAILGVLYMCLFFWPSGTQSTSLFESFGLNPRYTIAFQIPKAHGASPCGRPSSRRCTISRDSTLLRLWNEVFWGTRFIPAIGVLLASKHRGQVILFREDF